MDLHEVFEIALVLRKTISPSIAVTEHQGNDIGERHIPTLQREKRLIHLRIYPDGTSLASTRHNTTLWLPLIYFVEILSKYVSDFK